MRLMIQKGTRKIEITNGDNAPYDNGVRAYVTQGEFEKIYLGLRKNLMQRSIYRFKIDKDKFIDDCIFQINQVSQSLLISWKTMKMYYSLRN